MFSIKAEQPKGWKMMQQRGMRRFILVYGVLGWGVPSGILFSLVYWIWDMGIPPMIITPIAIILCPIGGILWGWVMWHFFKWMYGTPQGGRSDS